MAYFNEDNVTEQMCIDIAKEAGYIYSKPDRLPDIDIKEVRKVVYKLVDIKLSIEGAKTNRRYSLK